MRLNHRKAGTPETIKETEIASEEDGVEQFVLDEAQDEENKNMRAEFSEPHFSGWPLNLRQWLRSGIHNDISTEGDVKWLHETEKSLQRALRGYDMTAEIRSSRLTPNAALVRFRGTDDLTVSKIEKRKQELLTSHSIDVIKCVTRARGSHCNG